MRQSRPVGNDLQLALCEAYLHGVADLWLQASHGQGFRQRRISWNYVRIYRVVIPRIFFGRIGEWHVDIVKSPRVNEMGEKGLSCSDGFGYEPIFGKEAQQCVFLTRDGFANK